MDNDKKVLHLVLKSKWYEMQERDERTEDYRDNIRFWRERITFKHFTHVCFHKGYTNITFTRKINCIEFGYGRPQWGAPLKRKVIIIRHS